MTDTIDQTSTQPALLSVADAKKLDLGEVRKLTMAHLNPGQLHFMRLLGFDRVLIDRAEGMHYIDSNGRKILDFFGGFGSVGFGHNHPRIIEARKTFQDEQRQEICMAFMSQYASALAYNLAAIAPGDLDMVFLGSSGSEAMEAALKIAEQAQGPERSTIVYAENSFHGKTKGVLAVTDGALYRSQFKLANNTHRVPFGDIEALRKAFAADRSIGILVLETIQGGAGIVEAPTSYWRAVRKLCDEFGVLWIADEVQCGMGRSGRFFAFEHHGVIPDVTALAKALGGSKCAMAAMIARKDIYMKAYGNPKKALIHAPATFGGIGEACATSIEALNILYDDHLIENAETQGTYLIERLEALRAKYPQIIKEIRGRGLMVGVEFADISNTLPFGLRHMVSLLDDKLKGSICGFIGALLLAQRDVLVAFTEYNRNVIRLEPPLIVERAHIDQFVDALDDILSRGITGIVKDYIALIALSK
ncbi:aminotransferase class III-fold pyridoxal phosphate-dependent enzyme [Roseiarcaceae bacterium H3SJ34-1]|nr:aminotransferase class III-fold pyridoxal phosphate-dependent enzyme [Roseiarcaceae bacterium H3SJ34-1]